MAAFGEQVAWLSCLACLVVASLLFNPHTARSFEEDRVPMLRSLAILITAGLVICGMGMRRAARRNISRVMRSPLLLAALATTAASLLATVLGVAPRISFWGAYTRSHGAYLSLAYLAVFLGVVFLVRRPAKAEQLISIILLTSVPCVVYALLQHFGQDVTRPSRPQAAERVFSTQGNPIFLGAYLIMVAPLTLARLAGQARLVFRRRQPSPAEGKLLSLLLLSAYAALAALQLLVLALTQSRGPLLGLCAGLCVAGMLLSLLRGYRRAAAAIAGTTVAALGCLVILNIRAARYGSGAVPWLGRLGRLLEPHGSGRARLVYWEGAVQLLRADPARSLLGYGPDTTYLVYPRFSPPELAHLEGPEPILDRLHNETLESLATAGAFGAVSLLLAFVFFFHQVLRRLGLVAEGRRGAGFWCLVVGGGAAGLWGPRLAEGSFRLSGLGLPLGMVAGIVSYLTALAVWRRPSPHPGSAAKTVGGRELLLIGLFSAVVAHFVEIQFGIAIVATRLLCWTYLAVVVSMRLWPDSSGQAEPDRPPSETAGSGARAGTPTFTPAAVCTALAIIVLLFSLLRPALSWRRQVPALALVLGGAWLAGMAMAAGRGCDKRRRLRHFAAATTTLVLLFSVVYVPWASWRPAAAVKLVDWVAQQSHATSVLYGMVFLLVVVLPAVGAARGWLRGPSRPWGQAAAALCLLAAAVAAIIPSNLNVSRADCFARQGRFYRRAGKHKAAALLYAEASRLQPRQDQYVAHRALSLTAQARGVGRSGPTQALFREATRLLARAIDLSGRDFRHHRALARTHHLDSLLRDGTTHRLACARRADEAYLRALSLAPNHMKMRNEHASLWLDHAQHARAVEILQDALCIDPAWVPTRLLLAKVYAATGDAAKARTELIAAIGLAAPSQRPALIEALAELEKGRPPQ